MPGELKFIAESSAIDQNLWKLRQELPEQCLNNDNSTFFPVSPPKYPQSNRLLRTED